MIGAKLERPDNLLLQKTGLERLEQVFFPSLSPTSSWDTPLLRATSVPMILHTTTLPSYWISSFAMLWVSFTDEKNKHFNSDRAGECSLLNKHLGSQALLQDKCANMLLKGINNKIINSENLISSSAFELRMKITFEFGFAWNCYEALKWLITILFICLYLAFSYYLNRPGPKLSRWVSKLWLCCSNSIRGRLLTLPWAHTKAFV